MLTMNIWPCVGLCNGATGTVIDFIYHNNHQPPDLPMAVIVQFKDYLRGPSISDTLQSCVPIYIYGILEIQIMFLCISKYFGFMYGVA